MARGYSPGVQDDVEHECVETCEKKTVQITIDWFGVDGYLR